MLVDRGRRLARSSSASTPGQVWATTRVADAIKARCDPPTTATPRSRTAPPARWALKAAGIAVSDMKGYPNRFAGRGGLGAVMGSKGLKAIVVSDKGLGYLRARRQGGVQRGHARRSRRRSRSTPVSGQGLPTYGTNVLTNILSEAGGLPTRNFSDGLVRGRRRRSAARRQREIIARARGGQRDSHGCHTGCVIQCSRYWVDKDGHYKTKGPEYETVWSFGADCGINDLDEIAELDRACGDLGLDTIEMGATMGVYMDSGAHRVRRRRRRAQGARRASFEGGEPGRMLWRRRRGHGQGLRGRAGPRVQGAGDGGIRPAVGHGDRRDVRHQHHGRRPHGGILGGPERPQVRRGPRPPQAGRTGRDVPKPLQIATAAVDSTGNVPVHRLPPAGPARARSTPSTRWPRRTPAMTWDADALMQLGKETLVYEKLFNDTCRHDAPRTTGCPSSSRPRHARRHTTWSSK